MAIMTIKGPATLQDLLNTPKDGNKYELVDGEILVSPAGMRHSEVSTNIIAIIWEFLQKNPIGKVYTSDVGIVFPSGNVRSPHVTYGSIRRSTRGAYTRTPELNRGIQVYAPSWILEREVGERRAKGDFLTRFDPAFPGRVHHGRKHATKTKAGRTTKSDRFEGGDEEVGLFLPTGTLMIRRLAHQGHPESSTGLKPVAPLDRPQFRRQA